MTNRWAAELEGRGWRRRVFAWCGAISPALLLACGETYVTGPSPQAQTTARTKGPVLAVESTAGDDLNKQYAVLGIWVAHAPHSDNQRALYWTESSIRRLEGGRLMGPGADGSRMRLAGVTPFAMQPFAAHADKRDLYYLSGDAGKESLVWRRDYESRSETLHDFDERDGHGLIGDDNELYVVRRNCAGFGPTEKIKGRPVPQMPGHVLRERDLLPRPLFVESPELVQTRGQSERLCITDAAVYCSNGYALVAFDRHQRKATVIASAAGKERLEALACGGGSVFWSRSSADGRETSEVLAAAERGGESKILFTVAELSGLLWDAGASVLRLRGRNYWGEWQAGSPKPSLKFLDLSVGSPENQVFAIWKDTLFFANQGNVFSLAVNDAR